MTLLQPHEISHMKWMTSTVCTTCCLKTGIMGLFWLKDILSVFLYHVAIKCAVHCVVLQRDAQDWTPECEGLFPGVCQVYQGGIGSYALLVMVAAFLLLHPSRACPAGDLDLEMNLGVLLMDFLRLYGRSLNSLDVGISCRHAPCHALSFSH